MTSNARDKINNAVSEAAQLVNALRDYADTVAKAGVGERVQSALNVSTPSNIAYNNAALLAKGEQLFNLGVLNGPDLDIIRRTLPDPSTVAGQVSGPRAAREAVRRVTSLIQDRIDAFHGQYNVPPPNIMELGERLRSERQVSDPPRPANRSAPTPPPGFEILAPR